MRSLARRFLQSLRRVNRKSLRHHLFLESLERRAVLASGDILISEFMANPNGTDGNTEWVELVATKSINFATTPYSVVVNNNGTATNAGWIAGAALTYGFNISSGNVNAGDVFYVGGNGALINGPSSTALSALGTANFVRAINVSTTAGDTFGNSNSGGVIGNGGGNADGIAVFDVATSAITNSTVPIDAVFYGTALGTAVVSSGAAGYQLPVNDLYNGGKLQSNSTILADATGGDIIKATAGTFNPATNSFSTARTWGKVSLGTTTTFTTTAAASAGITVGTTSIAISAPASSTVSIVATDATKNEGSSGNTAFTFTVSRTSSSGAASVNWAVTGSGANAADATDFGGSLPSGTLNFIDTESSKTLTINVSGDTTVETNEGFTVTLSSPSSGMNLGTTSATGTIQNDDSSFSIAALSASKLEGNIGTTPFTFTVTRAGDTTATATVDYAAVGSGANPTDAADLSGAVTGSASFAIGATTATITINVAGDTTPEPDETFDVTLSNPSSQSTAISAIVGSPASATGTIQNDDAATTLSIAATDASKAEGNTGTTNFTFTVTRSGVTTGTSSATWTVTGSGTNPANTTTDFTAPITGTVSFAAGETSQVITVLVTGDTTIELNEGFTVTLSSPSSGTAISTASADGSIINDDLSVSLPTASIVTTEGNSGSTPVSVTVTRTGDTTVSTTVDWAVAGSGVNAADAADFVGNVLPSGTVTFAIGETTQTINFNIQGDTIAEVDETYTLTLSNASGGAAIGTATQSGTILTDDSVTLAAGDIAVIGYNASGTPDTISLLFLKDLNAGTVFYVSDNEVATVGGTSFADTSEAEATFTVSSGQTISAGTVVILPWGNQTVTDSRFTWTGHTSGGLGVTGGNFDDGIYIYTGTNATALTPTAFIYYVQGGTNAANSGNIPAGLNFGTTAINPTAAASRYKTSGATYTGTADQLRNAIGSLASNWENFAPSAANDWTFTVTQPQTITFGSLSTKTYGDTSFNLSATASSGLTVSYVSSDTNVATISGNTVTIVGAGTTTITANQAGGTIGGVTYASATPVPQTLTVNRKALTITADAKTKTYGAVDPAFTYSITSGGLVSPDTLSGSLSRASGSNVGTYAITQGGVTNAANPNYDITFVGSNLSITPAPLTITASNDSKTYGAAFTPTAFTTGTLFNGDSVSGVTLTSTGSPATATVGSYNIVPSAATGTGLSNYNISYANGSLTVNQRAVTITADPKSKTVGQSDPTLTFTASGSGLVNGDTVTLTRAAGETVGTYPITIGSFPASANYNLTYVGANFTINAAAAAPTFSGASVNGADTFLNAAQRSQITSLVLNFSAPVVIASGAFTVENIGLITAQSAVALATGQIIVTGSGTSTITLRWGSGAGVVTRGASGATGNSLEDGSWRLTIDSMKVTAQSDGSQLSGPNTFGATSTDNFFRMFGDNDGDGDVDGIDLIAARRAALLAPSVSNPYNAALDANGDGINFGQGIDSAFTANYGKRRRSF